MQVTMRHWRRARLLMRAAGGCLAAALSALDPVGLATSPVTAGETVVSPDAVVFASRRSLTTRILGSKRTASPSPPAAQPLFSQPKQSGPTGYEADEDSGASGGNAGFMSRMLTPSPEVQQQQLLRSQMRYFRRNPYAMQLWILRQQQLMMLQQQQWDEAEENAAEEPGSTSSSSERGPDSADGADPLGDIEWSESGTARPRQGSSGTPETETGASNSTAWWETGAAPPASRPRRQALVDELEDSLPFADDPLETAAAPPPPASAAPEAVAVPDDPPLSDTPAPPPSALELKAVPRTVDRSAPQEWELVFPDDRPAPAPARQPDGQDHPTTSPAGSTAGTTPGGSQPATAAPNAPPAAAGETLVPPAPIPPQQGSNRLTPQELAPEQTEAVPPAPVPSESERKVNPLSPPATDIPAVDVTAPAPFPMAAPAKEPPPATATEDIVDAVPAAPRPVAEPTPASKDPTGSDSRTAQEPEWSPAEPLPARTPPAAVPAVPAAPPFPSGGTPAASGFGSGPVAPAPAEFPTDSEPRFREDLPATPATPVSPSAEPPVATAPAAPPSEFPVRAPEETFVPPAPLTDDKGAVPSEMSQESPGAPALRERAEPVSPGRDDAFVPDAPDAPFSPAPAVGNQTSGRGSASATTVVSPAPVDEPRLRAAPASVPAAPDVAPQTETSDSPYTGLRLTDTPVEVPESVPASPQPASPLTGPATGALVPDAPAPRSESPTTAPDRPAVGSDLLLPPAPLVELPPEPSFSDPSPPSQPDSGGALAPAPMTRPAPFVPDEPTSFARPSRESPLAPLAAPPAVAENEIPPLAPPAAVDRSDSRPSRPDQEAPGKTADRIAIAPAPLEAPPDLPAGPAPALPTSTPQPPALAPAAPGADSAVPPSPPSDALLVPSPGDYYVPPTTTQTPIPAPRSTLPEPQWAPEPTPSKRAPDPILAPSTARKLEAASRVDPKETEDKLARIASRKGLDGLKGFCPVVLRDQRNLVDSRPEYTAVFNGRRYYFSSAASQALFEASPERYAPAAAGNDVVHLSLTGEELRGSLDHAVWYRGRLYLFTSDETMETFVAAPSIHARAD